MPLTTRPTPYIVPTYSLTGDLLAYLGCGLQYRYHNRGALPPSKPVQLWFGQFIHGVMEESYRAWRSMQVPFPWADEQLMPIVDLVARRLAAQGIHFQRHQLLGIAIERAFAAVNTWGPYLFPLISKAEVRLKGIRAMPPNTSTIRPSNYYEVQGIADVISSVQLSSVQTSNPIVGSILDAIKLPAYEVIVDYKGMRRPGQYDQADQTWLYHEWQVLTYAWLREQQPDASSVTSAVLLYLNELVPGSEDMDRLYHEVLESDEVGTDLPPQGDDLRALTQWPAAKREWGPRIEEWSDSVRDWWKTSRLEKPFPRMPPCPSVLSLEYRRMRSYRIVTVTSEKVAESLARFDSVVSEIEQSVTQESRGASLTRTWVPRPREETCTVCDFRTFCPADGNRYRGAPIAP